MGTVSTQKMRWAAAGGACWELLSSLRHSIPASTHSPDWSPPLSLWPAATKKHSCYEQKLRTGCPEASAACLPLTFFSQISRFCVLGLQPGLCPTSPPSQTLPNLVSPESQVSVRSQRLHFLSDWGRPKSSGQVNFVCLCQLILGVVLILRSAASWRALLRSTEMSLLLEITVFLSFQKYTKHLKVELRLGFWLLSFTQT